MFVSLWQKHVNNEVAKSLKKRHGGKDGVRSAEYGVRSTECGVRSAECGVRSAEYGVRSTESVSVKVFL